MQVRKVSPDVVIVTQDALSICFSLAGRRLMVDCGTYQYVSEEEERDFFRGTGAHKTVRIDGADQAIPNGPFAWSSVPEGRSG
ncbi:MAG: hypothetical protein DMG97_22395 [Acidobacteria bacterium]|nr:MAG: hypothetical protein DMG97_22395 [Acidobacteriota bacterium]